MTGKSDRDRRDAEWRAPGPKRPIACSTVAAKERTGMLAGCGPTVEQMHRASVIDSEAQKVLEAYIERGLGGKTGIELRFEGDAIDGRTERAVMDGIEWMPSDALRSCNLRALGYTMGSCVGARDRIQSRSDPLHPIVHPYAKTCNGFFFLLWGVQ